MRVQVFSTPHGNFSLPDGEVESKFSHRNHSACRNTASWPYICHFIMPSKSLLRCNCVVMQRTFHQRKPFSILVRQDTCQLSPSFADIIGEAFCKNLAKWGTGSAQKTELSQAVKEELE